MSKYLKLYHCQLVITSPSVCSRHVECGFKLERDEYRTLAGQCWGMDTLIKHINKPKMRSGLTAEVVAFTPAACCKPLTTTTALYCSGGR